MARRSRGFTLVELLVALFALSLLAVLSWRGLDGMARAQEQTRARADQVQALQVGLAQWTTDLDALVQLPQMTALDWNGRVVRLTRLAQTDPADGVLVVGWARRAGPAGGRWMRWQSAPLTTRGDVEQAWAQADAWARDSGLQAGASEVAIAALDDWQIFYFRSDAWTNPLSSDATQTTATAAAAAASAARSNPAAAARTAAIPDGVRIVLALSAGQAISGELTRDWVRPTVGGGKS